MECQRDSKRDFPVYISGLCYRFWVSLSQDGWLVMTSTTITDPVKDGGGYPVLKRFANDSGYNCVVLFTKKNTGFVVFRSNAIEWILGEYCDNWAEPDFTDFHGTVQLRNE